MFEVEKRGFLDEHDHDALLRRFKADGISIEEDHRETIFFVIPDATLKITRSLSLGTSKIAYKTGDIARSVAQKEYETSIAFTDFDNAVQTFKHLGFENVQETQQKRFNIQLGSSTLSLKWSIDWGYHFEIDTVVENEEEIASAEAKLLEECAQLSLIPLTASEFSEFCESVQEKYNRTS
jgi:Adenylate cyclase, class 2 (thermophilic)